MERKSRTVNPIAMKIAELIDRAVAERCGPEATFEERQELATAVAAEVAAQLARGPHRAADPTRVAHRGRSARNHASQPQGRRRFTEFVIPLSQTR
ncbi:MAG: hypothetical protein ABL886_12745 [Rhodoglobus sp.]